MLFHKVTDRAHVKEKCQEWVQRMELPEDTLSRFPSSFSGGQKQRLSIARAVANMKVQMNGRKLVGEIINDVDEGLGKINRRNNR